jgi:hypothetical protein
LRVPVFPHEKDAVEAQAKAAGMSVARYLRTVGMGYPIRSIVDHARVNDLAQINADLGRLGGLLKLWLVSDARVADFDPDTIRLLLTKIEAAQDEMRSIMRAILGGSTL